MHSNKVPLNFKFICISFIFIVGNHIEVLDSSLVVHLDHVMCSSNAFHCQCYVDYEFVNHKIFGHPLLGIWMGHTLIVITNIICWIWVSPNYKIRCRVWHDPIMANALNFRGVFLIIHTKNMIHQKLIVYDNHHHIIFIDIAPNFNAYDGSG